MYRLGRFTLPLLLVLGSVVGCQEQSRPAVTPSPEPVDSPTVAESPPVAEQGKPVQPSQRRPQADAPKVVRIQPQTDKWVIVRELFDQELSASCTAKWIRRNKFEIKTDNVRRMTVDMNKVPTGAPRKGPWILIIDGQGVELTGFKPKPGYTGRKRDLVRSPNGRWTVDRHKLYR